MESTKYTENTKETAISSMKLIQREMVDVSMTEEEIQDLIDEDRHGSR